MRDEDDEVSEEDYEAAAEPATPRRWGAASVWAGAAAALAAAGGLGLWLYDLGTRDTGAIPVVAAASGPVKTRPEGRGDGVAHSDIGAYELGAEGSDAPPPETVLAPETRAMSEEDISLRDLEDILGVPRQAAARSVVPEARPAPEKIPLFAPDGSAAPAARPEPDTRTAARALDVPAPTPRSEALAEEPPLPEPDPDATAPVYSPMAPPRPADLAAVRATARAEAAAEVEALRTSAARSPFQIQLGAFSSEDETRSEWARISAANDDLLHNRALAVQTTQSGGRTWYRLRVGPFSAKAEADSLCEALKARDQACIAVRNR